MGSESGGEWAFLVPTRKAYLVEVGGWLQKFHLSFCSPSLASSSYKAGVGNRCWSGWQQPNPPHQLLGAWRSSRGLLGQMLNGRRYLRAVSQDLCRRQPLSDGGSREARQNLQHLFHPP